MVKEIVVEPKKSLSMQRHFFRNEHWHVVKGKYSFRMAIDIFMKVAKSVDRIYYQYKKLSEEQKNLIEKYKPNNIEESFDEIISSAHDYLKNSAGKVIDISDGLIDNIMDTAYQRNLFVEWLKLNEVTVDYERLCRLDDKINEILINNEEEDIRYRRWSIKKLSKNRKIKSHCSLFR